MTNNRSRLESWAFAIFLVTAILAPLTFWPSPYMAIESVKTIVIVLGVVISAVLFLIVSLKEKTLVAPPKTLLITAKLIIISTVISTLLNTPIGRSLFGQGFEINTVGFIAILFLSAWVAFSLVVRSMERAAVLFVGLTTSFIILAILHILRFVLGTSFASFLIFNTVGSTPIGGWYGLGMFSAVIVIISMIAIMSLSLSRSMKILYWLIAILAGAFVYIIDFQSIWIVLALIFAGLTVYSYRRKIVLSDLGHFKGFLKKISWLPLVIFFISFVLSVYGDKLSTPVVTRLGANYQELSLPWQYSLDVVSGAIKADPLFGVGPNRFVYAYLDYKPASINLTDAWSAEFNYAFGLIPTFVATQGIVGAILWILFLVFFGVCGIRSLRNLSEDRMVRFVVPTSFAVASFLLIMMVIAVPPHAVVFMTFIMIGVFIGASVFAGSLIPYRIDWKTKSGFGVVLFRSMPIILIVIALILGIIYARKTAALGYFGAGVRQLTSVGSGGDATLADHYFSKAAGLSESDIYLQARTEAILAEAAIVASSVNKNSPASTTEAVSKSVTEAINTAYSLSDSSLAYDPDNYYNYLSKARISEAALGYGMTNAYETTRAAYLEAIRTNPMNPSIYLSLARLDASQNKLDEALKAVGASLQIKSNYLEAVFLLSQIEAAKGDLEDAINAAKFATELNPNNATLFFQLGMLDYNAKNYSEAAEALTTAIGIQPDYANARYFLGLSYAGLGKNKEAIDEFSHLAATNPDNQEVASILKNLLAGKSPFALTKSQTSTAPEKRTKLPIK